MKELYISPEVKLVCFLPSEKVANVIDFDDLISLGGKGDSVVPSDGDIDVGLSGQ